MCHKTLFNRFFFQKLKMHERVYFWRYERYKIFFLLIFVNVLAYMIRFSLSVAILGKQESNYNESDSRFAFILNTNYKFAYFNSLAFDKTCKSHLVAACYIFRVGVSSWQLKKRVLAKIVL